MHGKPEVLLHRDPGKPKVSIILIDWGVRESFHCLHYLNRQTADRRDYELIWLEFYDRKPEGLQQMVAGGAGVLDKWYVLGYPDDCVYHKHRVYNAGLVAAAGEVCVICDSDAVYRPTFVESLIRAFEEAPRGVVHLDQVRNNDRRFYPFNYPSFEDILGPGCVNWTGLVTTGLWEGDDADFLHGVNYGACMAARRGDLLLVGGADEHPDYLGYYCGPYEMTFRLVNYHGRGEEWLRHEYLYHLWHPNTSGTNTDYHGPNDGRGLSLRALDARATFRVRPYLKNPLLGRDWRGRLCGIERFLDFVKSKDEPSWRVGAQPAGPPSYVYCAERDCDGFNIFAHAGTWYGVSNRVTTFDPAKAHRGGYRPLLQAGRVEGVNAAIDALVAAGGNDAAGSGPLDRLGRRLAAQPLHCLPRRAWRQSRRFLSSLWPERPPWQPCARAPSL